MEIQPVTLTGSRIRLEPLAETHAPELALVGLDERIWRFMLYGDICTAQDLQGWIQDMLSRQKRGTDLPFAAIDLESGKAIGCTRYLDIHPEHRNVEIGGTWFGVAYQGTGVNTEAKYLLLKHAFETLGCLPRSIENGYPECALATCYRAHRCSKRRDPARPYDLGGWDYPQLGLLQYPGARVAGSESQA